MTIARAHLVEPAVSRWYHCFIRYAFVLVDEHQDRKCWIERRLQELAVIFTVSVGDFAVLDNRLHLLVRIDPAMGQGWTDEDQDNLGWSPRESRATEGRRRSAFKAWVH